MVVVEHLDKEKIDYVKHLYKQMLVRMVFIARMVLTASVVGAATPTPMEIDPLQKIVWTAEGQPSDNLEVIQQALRAANLRLWSYFTEETNQPDALGSAGIVEINGEQYLVTVSHVLENSKRLTLQIPADYKSNSEGAPTSIDIPVGLFAVLSRSERPPHRFQLDKEADFTTYFNNTSVDSIVALRIRDVPTIHHWLQGASNSGYLQPIKLPDSDGGNTVFEGNIGGVVILSDNPKLTDTSHTATATPLDPASFLWSDVPDWERLHLPGNYYALQIYRTDPDTSRAIVCEGDSGSVAILYQFDPPKIVGAGLVVAGNPSSIGIRDQRIISCSERFAILTF